MSSRGGRVRACPVSRAVLEVCAIPSAPEGVDEAASVRELITEAKSSPGKLTYGSYGNGSAAHLAAEQFKALTKTDIVHVPYKATSQLAVDLLSGRIDIMFEVMSNAAPQGLMPRRSTAARTAGCTPLQPTLSSR